MEDREMESSYLRCGHCRGFYEIARSHCRFCGKDKPMKAADGSAKVFSDRATCRAIQIAEYEQLPPEAHADSFQPDPELLDKLCYCLHCGPEGGLFEAVEMRWMVNENKWACPCTTCGGRGFEFDIHLAEPLWQCSECQHRYPPANGDMRPSNAKCPKCGCTEASGWFDDEETEEGDEDGTQIARDTELGEEDDADDFGPMTAAGLPEDLLPWTDEEQAQWEARRAEAESAREAEKLQDDIDFPHERMKPPPGSGDLLRDDDIPW